MITSKYSHIKLLILSRTRYLDRNIAGTW